MADGDLEDLFRNAMRRVASTVHVITITVDGQPIGMTATAVSSLTASPPSLLACVNQSASMHGALAAARHFCVNVLHSDQLDVSRAFSDSRMRDVRFENGDWVRDDHAPWLRDAQASLICERNQLIAFETHSIVIGLVQQVRIRDAVDPLIYLDGRYVRAD
ncbi:flavin reductase family protein [Sphingomonas sp. 1P06PA]|uniref:flavin reductase family protein n=1 Tax=Sphingomonas sp. 1P06PA TaxID=554121 RepID=UPI0039A3FF70